MCIRDSIEDQLLSLTNPTLASLETLLEGQAARIQQAEDIGANVTAVERLNALEQVAFFERLSDEQRSDLGDVLGLIEGFTGSATLALGQLVTQLDDQVLNTSEAISNASNDANTFQSIADGSFSARDSILAVSYTHLTLPTIYSV